MNESIPPDEFYKCECGWVGPDIHMLNKFGYDDLYCPKCGASNYSDHMKQLDDNEIKIEFVRLLILSRLSIPLPAIKR